jgi:alkylation response protein AidB-like acyl-CoA dehydrogenase
MNYQAPVREMLFALQHIAGPGGVEPLDPDTARAVLEECARFSEGVIAPLNRPGDLHPATCQDGAVRPAPGFAEAYRAFVDGGWQGLQHPEAYGGQGLPRALAAACAEMFHGASLSFALCPMLTDGAIEALLTAGSDEQRRTWLPPLVAGEWTGTMNLTEPQAGSDLSQVRCRAERQDDGSYRLFGTKIYITYGDHDMAANIVHLVLARTPDAPAGVKGISLFLVPKFLLDADGRPGRRNDVRCVSLEHKLGIRASPTAVLQFGDGLPGSVADSAGAGARGWLVGQERQGLALMFIMMNAARFAVGMQGVAIGERASQQALAFARERVQGRAAGSDAPAGAPIVQHPDVRRMLLTMRALTEGPRLLALCAAAAADRAHAGQDPDAQALHEFLVPLVKGFATEAGNEVAALGVQVHGGMGFIEETGAAQHLRDARILTIYEGTTAIQANDLVGRKTLKDGGAAARRLLAAVAATEAELATAGEAGERMAQGLLPARQALADAVDFMLRTGPVDPAAAYGGAVPYLMLAGCTLAGWQLARSLLAATAQAAGGTNDPFLRARIDIALFYAAHILPRCAAWRSAILQGAPSLQADWLAA